MIPAIFIHLFDIVVETVESDTSDSDDDNDSGEDHSGIYLKSTRWLKLAH